MAEMTAIFWGKDVVLSIKHNIITRIEWKRELEHADFGSRRRSDFESDALL